MRTRLITRILNLAVFAALVFTVGATTTLAKTSDSPAAPAVHQGAPAALGEDWRMHFENPQRTSYEANESAISIRNAGTLRPIWPAPAQLPNTNNNFPASSPVIYQGVVFLGGPANSAQLPIPNFLTYNAQTGTPGWSAYVGYHTALLCNPYGQGVISTAAAQGDTVVIGGADNKYYAFKVGGGQRWVESVGNSTNYYAWSSPLIFNPSSTKTWVSMGVATTCDPPYVPGAENAYDLQLGGPAQATFNVVPTGFDGGSIWQDAAASSDGKFVFVTTGNEDPNSWTGKFTRSFVVLDSTNFGVKDYVQPGQSGADQDWASGPTVFHDSGGTTLVGAELKRTVGVNGGYHVYKLDSATGHLSEEPWSPLLINEAIGVNAAYDPTSRAVSPGGTLYVPSNGGTGSVYAVSADTGAILDQLTVPHNAIWGQMAVANGLLFINDGGYLDVYNAYDFRQSWEFNPTAPNPPAANFSGVTVSHGIVYWTYGTGQSAYLTAWAPTGTP